MPKGHENLKPVQSTEEARERGRKGGIASGKARRDKKTVKKIVTELMNSKCSDYEAFRNITEKLGVEREMTVKQLFAIATTINTLKDGTLKDLLTLTELLGENEEANNGVFAEILEAVKGVDSD